MAAKRSTAAKETAELEGRETEILTAAARAFMIRGYAATSLDEVAEILGCTKGLIYYHFKSKADLFFAIHRYSMERAFAFVAPVAREKTPPSVRLRQMAFNHAWLIITENEFQRVSVLGLQMHVSGSTTARQRQLIRELTALRDRYEAIFASLIEEGIRIGELRKCNARLVTKPFLGALNWLALWYRRRSGESDDDRRALANEMADYVMNGLQPVA